jgi:hypothetical protein
MSFFEEIPGPELEIRETNRQPEWAAPPENVVGATFDVTVLRRTLEDEDRPFGMRFHRSFRFGLELPDGFKLGADVGGDLDRAMLSPQFGAGSDLRYTTERAAAERAVELWAV